MIGEPERLGDIVDVTVCVANAVPATAEQTLEDVIAWVERNPRYVGGLLRRHEAAVRLAGPERVAEVEAEGRAYLGRLPAAKALALLKAMRVAREST